MNTNHQHPLGIAIDWPEWSLAWADQWRPLLQRYRSELEWLLDRAADAAHELPNERACVERVRSALRKSIDGSSARASSRDVMFTIALVLAAIERDLGPVDGRPPRFRKHDPVMEVVNDYVARMARTYFSKRSS